MGGVVSAISDAVGGIVEAVGDAVESVGDAIEDVGSAIDDYVIQPILDDPLTAVATVAGAAILGPAIAPALGGFGAAAGAVGAGLGAAAGNTTAGLVQGEEFDEAIKGGVMAGVTAGVTQGAFDYFSTPSPSVDPLDELLAANNNFANVDVGVPDVSGSASGAIPGGAGSSASLTDPLDDLLAANNNFAGVDVGAPVAGTELPSLDASAPGAPELTVTAQAPTPEPSPLTQLATETPKDYSYGLKVPKLDPNAALPRDLSGNIDYSLAAGMNSTGPGLQLPSSPSLASMGGGQGLTSDVVGLPEFRYSMDSLDPSIRGTTDTWFGEGAKVYGNATPSGTVGEYGLTPTPDTIQYGPTPPAAPRTLGDKLKNFDFQDINSGDMKSLAGKAVDYAMENPLTTLAGITLTTGVLSQDAPQSAQAQPGTTQDPNFTRPMDLYNYLRSQQQYGDDIYRYGQTGGEHQFFTPAKFELVPKQAAMGGLIQMKQAYARGGQAAPMNPRMMQQGMPPQGMGRGMPQRGGLTQAMQTGNMPPAGAPQGMPQGRPQPMNRNPRTSYYQYGTPPGGAPKPGMAAGGALNMVRSYNIGGGADGRSDDVDAVLSDGEYVFDAETVALLGNGSSEAGADRLDMMREQIRKQKGKNLAQGKISPDAQSPLSYLKGA
jgi:hypothetical protein